ncbi:beta-galactosidase [Streptosporangium sp. NPDC002544]|uniref:beta-galactosidase n=1 Tax=Streptosporangium sp. NPDC002544 TaxID=3154538 RepID=UPI0033228A8F
MDWPRGFGGLCYGGDYNPEQWPEEVWKEDVELMRRAGVNLVSVGVFSWARLEPTPGAYDFGWLDHVLDLLHEGGVGVNLATPTASPPPWFGLAHPDALTVTPGGTRLTHGSRDTYCVHSPAYRAACAGIARTLAERYRDHPALAMWHVHNEYGTTCHCDHAADAFRIWLRARHGTLEALNDAWTTSFWSQHYSAWEQITPPRATQYLPNPAQVLDFRRFVSDAMLDHFREQKAVLRELTPDVPVTTNFVLGDWVPVNQRHWAAEVDLVAIDHYPSADPPAETAFAADLARGWASTPTHGSASDPAHGSAGPTHSSADDPVHGSAGPTHDSASDLAHGSASHPALSSAGPTRDSADDPAHRPATGKPWLLMEQAVVTYTGPRMLAKRPGEITRLSLSHIARGSRGAMFFQWRASRGGAELWHAGMVPHAGPDSRIFREICDLGALLPTLEDACAAPVEAGAAILWDVEANWALQAPGLPSTELNYTEAVRQAHRVLYRHGVTADLVHPSADLSAYPLVLVPSLYLICDADAENLRRYVAGGGTLVVSYLSGVADEHARVRLGGYPGALRDLLGIRVEEFHPLPPEVALTLSAPDVLVPRIASPQGGTTFPGDRPETGTFWSEHVHLEGAEALAVYTGPHALGTPLSGRPAITRHPYGSGTALYISTRLSDDAYARLLGLEPAPVELVRRGDWLFAINHGDEEQEIQGLHLPPGGFAVSCDPHRPFADSRYSSVRVGEPPRCRGSRLSSVQAGEPPVVGLP